MIPAAAANPWKRERQQVKARAIARLIFRSLPPEMRIDRDLPAAVANQPESERCAWAEHAAVNAPSNETWSLVVEEIRDLVEDQRRWLSVDAQVGR